MRVRTFARALLVLAMIAVPTTASAQRRGRRGGGQTQEQPAQQPAAGGGGDGAAGGGGGSMTFGVDEANQTPQTPPAGGDAAAGGGTTGGGDTSAGGTTGGGDTSAGGGAGAGGGLEGIGGQDVTAQRRPLREQIWAVQQIYALRNRRFELRPTVGFALNDPFVGHTAAGLSAGYWVSNVLAVGANFMWFQGLNARSDVDFRVARSTRLVVPVNEYQLGATANFTYVPVYGKFLMFNQYIFHWDIYVTAGVGVMRSRPIPVVDPEIRRFDWNTNILFNLGIGVRVFVNRWFGIVGEIHNYIYPEQLESTTIHPTDSPGGCPMDNECRQAPRTWLGNTALTDNVMVTVGLTFFLPPTFQYRLQR